MAPHKPAVHRIPFLLHSVLEYFVGAFLVALGVRSSGHLEFDLVTAGCALVVLNAATAAPLGAIPLIDLRAHRVLDVVIVVALGLSPLLGGGFLAGTAVIALALVLAVLARATRYRRRPSPASSPSSALSLAGGEVHETVVAAAALGAAAAPIAGRLARRSARSLGLATGVARRRWRAARAPLPPPKS